MFLADGIIITEYLIEKFPQIMDYKFTADMENKLDDIAEGKKIWYEVLNDFYNILKEQLDKLNIKTIENGLDLALKLRGVSFDKDGLRNVGLIAQEVREVIPEVVIEGKGEEKFLSVAYGNIVGVLIEAIKELNSKVEDLQNQLANK